MIKTFQISTPGVRFAEDKRVLKVAGYAEAARGQLFIDTTK